MTFTIFLNALISYPSTQITSFLQIHLFSLVCLLILHQFSCILFWLDPPEAETHSDAFYLKFRRPSQQGSEQLPPRAGG